MSRKGYILHRTHVKCRLEQNIRLSGRKCSFLAKGCIIGSSKEACAKAQRERVTHNEDNGASAAYG